MNISERIVMHTLVKVDGIEDFDSIPLLQKCIAAFKNHASLRKRFVNTENDNSLKKSLF